MITLTTDNGINSYFVDDGNGNTFTIEVPFNTDWSKVLDTINSMALPTSE